MAWYTIFFIITFLIFGIKLVLSWFLGDFDLDMDFDDVDDFDPSIVFSFKGLLHFLMGVSSYLFLRANLSAIDKVNGIEQFGLLDYMFATVCGVIFVICLYFGYKLALKANQKPLTPEDLIDNSRGTIYLNLNNGNYSVEAHTSAGTINVLAQSDQNDLLPGTEVILSQNKNTKKISLKRK